MLCSMPYFVLEQLLNEAEKQSVPPQSCQVNSSRKRGFCGHHPYAQSSDPGLPSISTPLRQLEVRELDDTYVLFLDMPGSSRSDVNVTVEGDSLHIFASKRSTEDELQKPSSSKDLVVERPRGSIKRSWRLPKDALLDGIHAKLHNGELTVIVTKRKAFSVPVLGADTSDTAVLPEPVKEPVRAQQAPQEPMAEPAAAVAAPAEPLKITEPEPAVNISTAPGAETLSEAMKQDANMADVEESDGSVEDVSDEEWQDYAAARRAKGKLPLEGPVLEEVERQEAEMKKQHESDSD